MTATPPLARTRMLDRCTVCGCSPDDGEITGPDQERHLAHSEPVCQDCDACLDWWPHDDNCPQAPLPEVVAIRARPNRWMVASRSSAAGAYWPVSLTHEGANSVMHCPCPAGRRLEDVPLPERRGCRHLVAVVRYVNDLHRRPTMPVDVGSFCD